MYSSTQGFVLWYKRFQTISKGIVVDTVLSFPLHFHIVCFEECQWVDPIQLCSWMLFQFQIHILLLLLQPSSTFWHPLTKQKRWGTTPWKWNCHTFVMCIIVSFPTVKKSEQKKQIFCACFGRRGGKKKPLLMKSKTLKKRLHKLGWMLHGKLAQKKLHNLLSTHKSSPQIPSPESEHLRATTIFFFFF